MIEVSIIIPIRNQKDSLLQALNSLKRQIKKRRVFEIVICDDCSTDGAGDAIKRLRYPIFLKYIRNDPPLGRAANRNLGFQKSSGKELIFLDGDMVPADNYIDVILSNLEPNIVKLGVPHHPKRLKFGRFEKYQYTRGRYSEQFKERFLPSRLFTSNSFYISRENFQNMDGFDTGFQGWGGEDIDFGMRLEMLNIKIENIPEAVTYHYHERTIKSLAADYYDFGINSFEYLIKKHPDFLKQIPVHFLGLPGGAKKINLLHRLISFFAINRLMLNSIEKILSSSINSNWPDYLFDYVFWGNLALGYKNWRKTT